MVLLMIGVFFGRGAARPDHRACRRAADRAPALDRLAAGGEGVLFNGAFVTDAFCRFMKVLALVGSVVALVMSVGCSTPRRTARQVRISRS